MRGQTSFAAAAAAILHTGGHVGTTSGRTIRVLRRQIKPGGGRPFPSPQYASSSSPPNPAAARMEVEERPKGHEEIRGKPEVDVSTSEIIRGIVNLTMLA